ncbi:MAG: zinc ABC transporter substrate-binding protein [gamma proteobacterium symbiont of Taylorina sp.]|nr:zinc ABC transporter substrate-binding protein [gamma proteobacterium symbiont of Taylorina sp.]
MKTTIKVVLMNLLLSMSTMVKAEIQVLACEPEWGSLVNSLGGKQVNVYQATTNQQDPHHIQARPSLIAKARRADLLVCAGAELEAGWLPLLLRKSGNPDIQAGKPGYFMASDYVTLLDKATTLDRSYGDVHAAGNPHVHLDPERLLKVAQALSQTLIAIDPDNQENYQINLNSFTQKWLNMGQKWRKQTLSLTNKSIVVYHRSWIYLQKWLGLNEVGALEPKPGIPPTSSHLTQLLVRMKQTPADMIIYASYQDSKAAKWLSQKTGIPTVMLNISPDEGESLFDWYQQLIDRLVKEKK